LAPDNVFRHKDFTDNPDHQDPYKFTEDDWLTFKSRLSPGPPLPPTNFSASAPSTTSVLVTWTAVANATYYVLGWGPSFIETTFAVPSSPRFYLFTGLSSGISYHFDIQACNANGCGPSHGVIGCTPSSC